MLRSMTGFGTARAEDDALAFVAEIRSVNHKFCDVRCRLPRELSMLDSKVGACVRGNIDRGRVEVSVEMAHREGVVVEPRVDMVLAQGFKDAFSRLSETLDLEGAVTLQMIAASPGVIEAPSAVLELDVAQSTMLQAVQSALTELNAMRSREGEALLRDIQNNLSEVESLVAAVVAEIPRSQAERREKLEKRIDEIANDKVDPARLAQEVAILVDKSDVSEEVVRLASHIAQFRKLTELGKPVGRKLDFLLQEMNREANTIGSKISSAVGAHIVVDLKSAIERIREQVQNVE